MGFEDTDEAKGFEADQLDLDSDKDISMGTGRIKAQRKKGIKTETKAFSKPKRDRFGRRSDGEEDGIGADMLNPDKPTKISGGMSHRDRETVVPKPLNSDSSKFGYLFAGEDGDDEDFGFGSGASRIDGLAMTGEEDDADERFARSNNAPVRSNRSFSRKGKEEAQPKPEQPVPEKTEVPPPEPAPADTFDPMSIEPKKGSRFSKRTEEKKPRFSKKESEKDTVPPAPLLSGKTPEDYDREADAYSPRDMYSDVPSESSAYPEYDRRDGYSDMQMYYGQYGGYPPYPYAQNYPPYQQNPYMQPYGYPPYPQYPQIPYPQVPQFIPEGYVYQAGFVPIEKSAGHGRRHKVSASRSAYRYDHTPDVGEERPGQRVRAVAARREETPVRESLPLTEDTAETPVEEKTYPSQFDRIFSEVPQIDEAASPVEAEGEPISEEKTPSAPHGRFNRSRSASADNAPSRFSRGSSEPEEPADELPDEPMSEESTPAAPSRFSRRSGSEGSTAAPSTSGGRFNKRG